MTAPRWAIDSETGRLREVLLCRPDHYSWQATNAVAVKTLSDKTAAPDRAAFDAQYDGMVQALEAADVTCRYLAAPEPQLPYQVYTRDSSQITPWGPVITQLYRPQRRGEYAGVIRFYDETCGGPWRYSTAGTLEGGDIHIIRPGLLLVGYSGERTDEAGARQFAQWFETEGWEVRLEPFPEHFLHMDVIFSMVARDLALACLEVMDDDLIRWLQDRQIRLIPVSYKDAMQLSCNVLALGDERVLSASHSSAVNAALRAEGLTVIETPLDLFTRGGGGVHCMTMPLARDPV
ncbi:MAG: arginine deiminase family protein [Marivibrio sp.]|uniref:dimethylarginine dimethylaminohydrolase family protein n=1 Tax=Marivibrio sp. TaxID=2039719 RepID=UPI0032EADF99